MSTAQPNERPVAEQGRSPGVLDNVLIGAEVAGGAAVFNACKAAYRTWLQRLLMLP